MGRAERCYLIGQVTRATLYLALATLLQRSVSLAQSVSADPAPVSEASRIERLEKMVTTVVEENRRLSEELRSLKQQVGASQSQSPPAAPPESTPPASNPASTPQPPSPTLPGATSPATATAPPAQPLPPPSYWTAEPIPELGSGSFAGTGDSTKRFRIEYKDGLAILPDNIDETPFSLRIRSQDVFRYDGFSRSEKYWIDSAGVRKTTANSNYFAIPRGRVIFSGTTLMPKLTYLLNIDYNSVTNNPIGFRAYELSYHFSKAFNLSVGQNKVPGSREWLESAFAPLQGPDRSMATTFFRPSLSQGVWINGQPTDTWHYYAMVSNGFNTLNLIPDRLNNRFCWSGSTWWEPLGEFGPGYSDLQNHKDAAIRLGTSYSYAIGRGNQAESDAVENSPVRLSDGTIITDPNALAQGVTLQSYDISLAAVDLSYKYRGLGLSTEMYFQNLLDFKGTGPLPVHSTAAFGGFLQGGYFILPQKAELYARTSYVTGHYGAGSEVAGGFNWFFLEGKENLRYTFDAAWLDRSPAGQNRTGYVAGQTGLLIRTQITVVY